VKALSLTAAGLEVDEMRMPRTPPPATALSPSNNQANTKNQWHGVTDNGNQAANYELAIKYRCGRGVVESKIVAFQMLEALAQRGHPKAQFDVGEMYADGEGVERDLGKAYDFLAKAYWKVDGETRRVNARLQSIVPELLPEASEETWISLASDMLDRLRLDLDGFCIFSAGALYVQFAPLGSHTFVCEAVSSAYSEEARKLVKSGKLALLRFLGFAYNPSGNYTRSIEKNSREDAGRCARLALEVLRDVYDVETYRQILIKIG
jgi:hypothetical protein